jgi:outer membrane protein OmpA-like peptidoglycan-associated protein
MRHFFEKRHSGHIFSRKKTKTSALASLTKNKEDEQMRYPLIAVVLLATGGTFYSALTFQSAQLEADMEERVTRTLAASGAKNIQADGGNAALSGVSYSTANETAYLKKATTADDGLVFTDNMAFVTAIKSDKGITLRGTVPTEEVRASLVSEAAAATGGTVEDQLVIAGTEAAWIDEASFGLSQLAALSAGTLTASDGSYALSGMTKTDAQAVETAVLGRDGWQAFIAGPATDNGSNAELTRLTQELQERDANLTNLNTLMQTLNSSKADLSKKLTAAEAQVIEATDAVEKLTASAEAKAAEAVSLGARIALLEQQIANTPSNLGSEGEQVAALRTQLDTALSEAAETKDGLAAELAAVEEDLVKRDTRIAELSIELAALNTGAESLDTTLADRDSEIAELRDQLDDLAEVEATLAARDAKIAELTATLDSKATELASLNTARAEHEDAKALIGTLQANAAGLEDEVETLAAALAERKAATGSLDGQPGSKSATLAAQCEAHVTSMMDGSRINFRTGTTTLDAQSTALMERLTGVALACVGDDLGVMIGGHTDDRGTEESNQELSEKRAEAILEFMTERGVPASTLKAIGFGETQPIADNTTSAGRATNRRISFEWKLRDARVSALPPTPIRNSQY